MKRLLLATAISAATVGSAAYAQQQPLRNLIFNVPSGYQLPQQEPQPPTDTLHPVQPRKADLGEQLKHVFTELKGSLSATQRLVARLKEANSPGAKVNASKEIQEAEGVLGALEDRLTPNGDVVTQLNAIKHAAQLHYNAVKVMTDKQIDPSDRRNLMNIWQGIVTRAGEGVSEAGGVEQKVGFVLGELQRKQTAVAQYILADEYEAAVKSFDQWVNQLSATVQSLHKILVPNPATS